MMVSKAFRHFLDCIDAGDDRRTEAAAQVLVDVANVADVERVAIPTLRDLLEDADADRRWWGVRGLAAVGAGAAGEGLRETLADALASALSSALVDVDASVRTCAVQAAGELRLREVIPELVACLADPDPLVARVSADSLGRLGAPAVPALIAALRTGETTVRAGAARALYLIQPEQAITALCEALDDPSAIVSYYAGEALERMGVGLVLFSP